MPRSRRIERAIRGAVFGTVFCGVVGVGWVAAQPEAAPAELVVELRPGSEPRGERMGQWLPLGNGIVFRSGRPTGEPRPRLWFTDGTTDGTRLLRDGIEIDSAGAGAVARLPDGRALIPRFPDSGLGSEPWITDGTVAGTVLLADLCKGPCSSSVSNVTRAGGRRFFLASVDSGVRRLLSLGPALELEVLDVSNPQAAVPLYDPAVADVVGQGEVPDLHLLVAIEVGPSRHRLDRISVGGASQTVLDELDAVGPLLPFREGALTLVSRPDSSTNELVFVGQTGASVLLEGEGLVRARALHPASGDDEAYPLAFVAQSGGFGEPCQVWRTDGTVAGTWSLGEFPGAVCFEDFKVVGGRAVLFGQSSQTFRVASTDGTLPGFTTLHAADVGYGERDVAILGNYAYWLDEQPAALMRTDGLQPALPVCTFEQVDNEYGDRLHLPLLGDALLFTAQGGDGSGMELWRWEGHSCGADAIANLVSDAVPTRVEATLALGPRLFVQEQTNTTITGAFQQIVEVDVSSGASTVIAEDRALWSQVGDRLILENGNAGFFSGARIYGLDTRTGTEVELLETFPHRPGRVDDGVFLAEISALTGYGRVFDALWFSDGTLEGTRLVRSFRDVGGPGFYPWGRNGVVIDVGTAVWRSDGTEAGTVPLIEPGFGLVVHGVADGAAFVTVGQGEGASPLLAIDVATGTPRFAENERLMVSNRDRMDSSAPFRNRLLFFAELPVGGPAGGGPGLWLSDGSTLGTQLLGRLSPDRNFDWPPITTHRGLAFLNASGTEAGGELFVSDGAPAGTRLLIDAVPGAVGSNPTSLRPVDGVVALERTTLEAGRELWLTDGAVDGTRVVEIEPGPLGSVPAHAVAVSDKVVFAADRSDVGRELFSLDRGELRSPCRPTTTAACLGDGRFRVEADWLDRPSNTRGRAEAVPFTEDTARFWFFDEGNIELVVKVLDGRVINDEWWVFYGATSDVDYWVTVTDTWSGESKSYTNRRGNQCGVNDTSAFRRRPELDDLLPVATESESEARQVSTEPTETLSMHGGRFEARVRFFVDQEPAQAAAIHDTEQSGYFWFFDSANVELIVKVLDGRDINGNWWVYHGGLSDLRYELEITDTETGAVWRDENPAGSICGDSDIRAFADAEQ